MAPSTPDPWIPVPFAVGARYRVRHDFKALRDTFASGEELVYDSCAWSRYDGLIGYLFSVPGSEGMRVWDLGDDQDAGIWREHFELSFHSAAREDE